MTISIRRKWKTKAAVAGVGAALPGLAIAHPDHLAGGGFGFLHFMSDPFHLGLSALAIGLAGVAARAQRRRVRVARRER